MDGIMLINKEKGYTSRDVVNVISRHLKIKKVGHTGTLDPMATGVLVLCIGKATKLVDVITSHDKEYIAKIILGIETDTLDVTGNILKKEKAHVVEDEVVKVLNSMLGKYEQEVPIYSAVKINGKKLYEYARNNESVKLPKREVDIKSIDLIGEIEYTDNQTIFSFRCLVSKGTYIRSLIRDIAYKLNTVGVMAELTRTKQDIIRIEDCATLDEVVNDKFHLIDIRSCIPNIKQVKVNEDLEKDILNGKLINNVYETDMVMFINAQNSVLAIYHLYDKDNNLLKPWKMLK